MEPAYGQLEGHRTSGTWTEPLRSTHVANSVMSLISRRTSEACRVAEKNIVCVGDRCPTTTHLVSDGVFRHSSALHA